MLNYYQKLLPEAEIFPNIVRNNYKKQRFKTDYNDINEFESDLNEGKSMEGKVVSFVVDDIKPQSAFGYNLITGEHLNFVSTSNPNVKVGDTVIVKVTEVSSMLGAWSMRYDMM